MTHCPPHFLLVAGVIISSLAACSVKEDRADCPCYLEIDVKDCHRVTDEVELVWHPDRGAVSADKLTLGPWREIFGKQLPRGVVSYYAYSGVHGSVALNGTLTIPEGKGSDSLYVYSTTLDTSEENAWDKVYMHKQFAVLTIAFAYGSGMDEAEASVVLRGGWNGLDLYNLTAVRGVFRCRAARNGGNLWTVTVPRQGDDSLVMDISCDGMQDTIPLGEILGRAGYDWSSQDLEDVRIDLDWMSWSIKVEIESWADGKVFEIQY